MLKSTRGIVAAADLAANDLIVTQLSTAHPDVGIYTEEDENRRSEDTTRFIVDPLDGTTPWVYGNSGFAVSVAVEHDGDVVAAAVYDPVFDELYYAEEGQAATRNNKPIRVTDDTPLHQALLVVDWGNADGVRHQGLAYFERFFVPEMQARRAVPQFAPALGLCRVAEGRIHALVCNDTWVEDHAAGALIAKQAGASVHNFDDTECFTHRRPGIIAACSGGLYREIRAVTKATGIG